MSEGPEIVLVAALGRNRVIGADGGMPWHLPADLKRFKAVTLGYPIIMGRRTFESIGRPLPGRRNIVLSTSMDRLTSGVDVFESLDQALAAVDAETVMVIGGGTLYAEALPRADRLELTFVDAEPEGDTHFPAFDLRDWRTVAMHRRGADDDNEHAVVFCTLARASAPS
jgi:dihydrofolate reductase